MQAQQNNNPKQARIELEKASLVGIYSKIPAEGWVDYYISLGRYDLAADQLSAWPLKKDPVKTGEYYLLGGKYIDAQRDITEAIKREPSSELYALLAKAEFNQEKVAEGCNAAGKAAKNNLRFIQAPALDRACVTLQAGLKARADAYQLINIGIYTSAEKYLDSLKDKSPSDWSTLASLAAARGDYRAAIDRAKSGTAMDPTNKALQSQLTRYYSESGDQDNSKKSALLRDLLDFKY